MIHLLHTNSVLFVLTSLLCLILTIGTYFINKKDIKLEKRYAKTRKQFKNKA